MEKDNKSCKQNRHNEYILSLESFFGKMYYLSQEEENNINEQIFKKSIKFDKNVFEYYV